MYQKYKLQHSTLSGHFVQDGFNDLLFHQSKDEQHVIKKKILHGRLVDVIETDVDW